MNTKKTNRPQPDHEFEVKFGPVSEEAVQQVRDYIKCGSLDEAWDALCVYKFEAIGGQPGIIGEALEELEDEIHRRMRVTDKPVFTTKRLSVYEVRLIPPPCDYFRRLFLAFESDRWGPIRIAAYAIVQSMHPATPIINEWLEFCEAGKDEGIGQEFFEGLREHIGRPINLEAVNEDEKNLERALYQDK